MTQAGVILGTAAYMSPEQAKGPPLDRRSDVWAFGVVFYEMLTGQRVFRGEDVSETLALVLTREPEWTVLPVETPPLIRRLLRRCLEKDRKRRLDSAADARLEIEEVLSATAVIDGRAARACAAPGMVTRADVDAGRLDTRARHRAGLALWAPWRIDQPADRPLIRLDVDLGADVSMPAPPTAGEQHRHLARWHAAGLRLGQPHEAVRPPPGSNRPPRSSRGRRARPCRSSRRTGNGSASSPAPS